MACQSELQVTGASFHLGLGSPGQHFERRRAGNLSAHGIILAGERGVIFSASVFDSSSGFPSYADVPFLMLPFLE